MTMKTGARILALSALSAVLFSASAVAKIEEGKLVIWINLPHFWVWLSALDTHQFLFAD